MAKIEISLLDGKLFSKLLMLCRFMICDPNVPERYKQKIQRIVEDKKNREFKRHPKVLYLCDHRACELGCNRSGENHCDLTSDIRHARNFTLNRNGSFVEKEQD